ncbi:hypothetical protein DVA67_017850 [Solirubrobacter sp. CPCC 204708]|uniref:DUF5615 domain-containing protein n=1 Tax=Solirubrobacter deserti TaxID=2282478 RepID=A0ABT4RCY4_9ACTN|nr:hypothetical protein [Solirubrobacter deserti]MBE2317851.1 hypothetical protein [Solirubrobacter deserti]MDA0136372.1 hypothetical protein [Solirubrobacter deserti]
MPAPYPLRVYLDQNYLSGFAKRKPALVELEPVLRAAVTCRAVAVVESPVHERESAPRPDLGLLEQLRSLSGGRRLPDAPDPTLRHRMQWTIAHELPERACAAATASRSLRGTELAHDASSVPPQLQRPTPSPPTGSARGSATASILAIAASSASRSRS